MKTANYFKQFLLAVAALTLVGTVSSCRDNDFDWDNAHANTAQKKFSDTFFKEFGKPADGHQWGFDKPWVDKYITRADVAPKVYKADTEDATIPLLQTYGVAPSITETEHKEVYEWFATHQIKWTTNTTNYDPNEGWRLMADGYKVNEAFSAKIKHTEYWSEDKNLSVGDLLTKFEYDNLSEENKAKCSSNPIQITQNKGNNVYGTYIVKVDPINGEIVPDTRIDGDFMILKGDNNPEGMITLRAGNNTRMDGVAYAYAYNGGTPSTSSLYTYSSDKNGDTPVGITIDFNHAWLQYVASDTDSEVPDWCKEKTPFGEEVSGGMDQLYFYGKDHVEIHGADFNSKGGWGWNNQSILEDENGHWLTNDELQAPIRKAYNDEYEKSHDINKANNAAAAKYNELMNKYNPAVRPQFYNKIPNAYLKNGVLMFGADFNQTTYKSSKSISGYFEQDKWIIVYLKGKNPDGTFYEGWYLGFDLSAAGDDKGNLIEANGFCNNWIIKLTAVNAAVSTEPIRIMCEDLGGEKNEVQIGDKIHISDIDYNDIVLDVTPDETDNKKVSLTLQAAGGTIPLTVWYDGTPLFETHEMFQRGKSFKDNDHKTDVDYSIMYNTYGGDRASTKDNVPAKTYNLVLYTPFDINKLQLKVWRLDADSYKESAPNDFSDALWVNISNIAGEAPLKISVPQYVPWLRERCSINQGYPYFREWVQDPSNLFWGTKNSESIHQNKVDEQYLVR